MQTLKHRSILKQEVTNTLSEEDINIDTLYCKGDTQGYAYVDISVEVKTVKELSKLIKRLSKIPEILSIYRI